MAYDIGAARAQVLDHLDDESGARFARASGATSYVKLDRALRSAADRCLDDYVRSGGDRFDEKIEVTTSADDGTVALAAYEPLKVRGVLYAPSGSTFTAIEPGDDLAGYTPDLAERELTLKVVRRFPIAASPDSSDLLLGTVDGAARSWDAFDEWVCCRAAIQLGIKDNEKREMLLATRDDLERSIKGGSRNPQAKPWGVATRRHSAASSLSWLWTARTQTLQLVNGGR
jgi:hypothetical protein